MTFPTEHGDNATSIGPTNIKHPIITFRVLMNRRFAEDIGPKTNSKSVNLLHPDMHDSSPDRGRTNSNNHETQFQPFIPGILNASNIVRNDDGTFTAYGQQAVYLKTQYADIVNPVLEVQNAAPFTSA